MKLRVGYELRYEFPQPTPAILMLNIHFSRVSDLQFPDHIVISPPVPISGYRDGFGNWCSRIVAPAGQVRITADSIIGDSGQPDPTALNATQVPVEALPEEALVFLLASRFCDSDRMLDLAWELFGKGETGWARVQMICNFVHNHIVFGYTMPQSITTTSPNRPTMTLEGLMSRCKIPFEWANSRAYRMPRKISMRRSTVNRSW